MKMKKHGSGSFGPAFQGSVMKKKEPSLFIKEKSLDEIKYLGVGFFEWMMVLGIFSLILSVILKKF